MTERDDREQQRWAHDVTAWAVRNGYLVRSEDCESCGRIPGPGEYLVAHHWLGYAYEVALVVQWLCPSCHSLAHDILGSFTLEERSRHSREQWAQLTPDERSELMRQHWANLPPEAQAAVRQATGTASRARWAELTPQERSEVNRERSKTMWARRTSDERSEFARLVWADKTPEERSEIIRKRWETRRARYGPSGVKP